MCSVHILQLYGIKSILLIHIVLKICKIAFYVTILAANKKPSNGRKADKDLPHIIIVAIFLCTIQHEQAADE
jgi:hypothetical protein